MTDGTEVALVQNPGHDFYPTVSPNGRWLAYSSFLPTLRGVVVGTLSTTLENPRVVAPGQSPMWSYDGRELFYFSDGTMWVAPIITDPTFRLGPAEALFSTAPYRGTAADHQRSWDIHPDGDRFLMIRRAQPEAGPDYVVVLNWLEELKRLVPVP